jgi:hypothetical protein
MRLWAPAVVTPDLPLHCLAAKSRPEEEVPRLVPVQVVPGAKGCSRPLALSKAARGFTSTRYQILLNFSSPHRSSRD